MQIVCVTFDCANPQRLADFWTAALAGSVVSISSDGAYVRPRSGPGLEFIRVDEPKSVKNRVHLGTRVDDVNAEVERLVALGATVAWEEHFPQGWPYRNVVLRDPEGNEFCLGDEPAH